MFGLGIRLIAGLVLAVVLSQAPEFVQQYRQRLGGAIDALAPIVSAFDALSRDEGLSRAEALARLERNPDTLAVGQTRITADAIERYDALRRQQAELSTAAGFERLVIFGRGLDPTLASRTFEDFRPAVPATVEGAFHAGGGFVLGYGLAAVIARGCTALFRRRRYA